MDTRTLALRIPLGRRSVCPAGHGLGKSASKAGSKGGGAIGGADSGKYRAAPRQGDAGIKNVGATTSGAFKTRLSYRTRAPRPTRRSYDFNSGVRQPNGGDHWDRTFDFQEGGTYTFKAEVDADKQIAESAEGNNTKTLAKSFAGGLRTSP